MLVRRGRAQFLRQFASIAAVIDEDEDALDDPSSPDTFARCKLDFAERERHAPVYALHADLLRLRRTDPAFSAGKSERLDAAVLSPQAFVLRFFCDAGDRLLVVNLGLDLDLVPAPEPLLAPPEGLDWRLLWSSEDPRYGGRGAGEPHVRGAWRLPAESALAFEAAPAPPEEPEEDAVPAGASGAAAPAGEARRRG